ncbi:MAG TPA: CHRD domain-containing protein [Thermoanaerobaculia bacterium]|nr:CHRD domain-containing protein [Thermoanaerobaculia bacterium]
MIKFSLSLLALIVVTAPCAQAQSDPESFFAELRGTNEVPRTNSPAVGAAFVTIDGKNVITYEVSIAGMADQPSLAHIHENVIGENGAIVASFATSPSAFQNGRVKGTIQADSDVAKRMRENPNAFYVDVHSDAFPDGEIRGQLLGANAYSIAVAGNVTTSAGDKFVTDVRIFNPRGDNVVALVEFFSSGPAGSTNASASKPVEIPARGEVVLDDVAGASFLNIAGQIGALRITSHAHVAVTANIYNDQRSANKGTFGQFVPAAPASGVFPHGVIPHLSNQNRDVSNPQGFRTNVGFFNPNQSTASVTLTLRDSAGELLGTTTLQLAPLAQQQLPITAYFPNVDLGDARALTLEYDSAPPVLAYGAVNDNVSGDSIFVPGQSIPNFP